MFALAGKKLAKEVIRSFLCLFSFCTQQWNILKRRELASKGH